MIKKHIVFSSIFLILLSPLSGFISIDYIIAPIISLIPLLSSIYYLYKKENKKKLYSIWYIILLPLIGSSLFPIIIWLTAHNNQNRWIILLAMILTIDNVILYIVNEIILWYNLRKMSQK